MSEEPTLPDHMPLPLTPVPVTRIPRVFSIWGTLYYGVAAIASITVVLIMGFTRWMPPWYIISSAFLYVFISTGIICTGRIQANKDARFFIHALKKRSEDNQRKMRRMN
jgi:hypothetical protein